MGDWTLSCCGRSAIDDCDCADRAEYEAQQEAERRAIRLLWNLGFYDEPMPRLPIRVIQGAMRVADRIAALEAEILRLTEAVAFAHGEGCDWPCDPLPLGCIARELLDRPASADTHPKDGDVQQAPLVSGAAGSEAGETPNL